MGEHIYYGPWINWAHGPILGATLTLGDRSGGLLTAFIATFVTIVGAQLFRILTYIFHQARSRQSVQDGLYHQQQVVFRNTTTPGGAAWTFLVQWWTWSGRARLTLIRTIPWAFFCLSYMALFGVAAVFSSEITKGPGSARLVIGETCGYWESDGDGTTIAEVKAYGQRVANTSLAAADYARSCYGGSYDVLSCSKLTKPSISTTVSANASCPFAQGMCTTGDTGAYEITTQKIDSLYDLGINSRHSDRLEMQKVATCAPVTQDGFTQTLPGGSESGIGLDGDTIYQFMYGPSKLGTTDLNATNYTHQYNDHTVLDSVSYMLSPATHNAGPLGIVGGWEPVPEVNRTDADVALLFLMQNGVSYSEPVDDPMFAAHDMMDLSSYLSGAVYYNTDKHVTTMGCTDQYRLRNPDNNQCTDLMGIMQILPWIASTDGDRLELNTIQQAIAIRLMRSAQTSSIGSIIFAMGENALLAKDVLVQSTMSAGLPSNQWQLEMESWVNKGLADLQLKVVEYATGPASVAEGSRVYQPWKDEDGDSMINAVAESMCYSQMINDTTDTISFSILGMVVLFGIGGFIILLSLFIDILVGWMQQKFNFGTHARMCWLLDDKLQLHKYLNQELGNGKWTEDLESMPFTVVPQQFSTLAVAHRGSTVDDKVQTLYQPQQYQSADTSPKYSQVTTEEDWLPK
ncbi:hypothetical protein OHC33_002594 [Knufia fluminis]|uniref:Uncharacterized protein n=1 Tax=Knufia fluminis TaxID=191047 RepID=A0AAN8FCY5_9EURO|nr:hypothetical protein OHC33_002594 [Knufia fluminis]